MEARRASADPGPAGNTIVRTNTVCHGIQGTMQADTGDRVRRLRRTSTTPNHTRYWINGSRQRHTCTDTTRRPRSLR